MNDLVATVRVDCPYCGQRFETVVDLSAGNQSYYEDCQICCAPIGFEVQTDGAGQLLGLSVRRDDE